MLVAACAVALMSLGGCAASSATDLPVTIGQLDVDSLVVTVDATGDLALTAAVTNTSGVDRAFTVRWIAEGQTFEQSRLVPARSAQLISVDDAILLVGVDAEVGDLVTLTLVEGFFSRSDESAHDVIVNVTAHGD